MILRIMAATVQGLSREVPSIETNAGQALDTTRFSTNEEPGISRWGTKSRDVSSLMLPYVFCMRVISEKKETSADCASDMCCYRTLFSI